MSGLTRPGVRLEAKDKKGKGKRIKAKG